MVNLSMVMNFDENAQINQRPDLLGGIIGSAMDAIIAIDEAQRIVFFNSAAERMFVCPANEAIGSSIERFIPERFRAEHSTHVRRFAETGVTNRTLSGLGTVWGLRTTGEEFPIEASISKVESDGDMDKTSVGKGLGLTSMRERVWLVNGTFSIQSKPMRGTTIHVRVPLESEQSERIAV